MSQQLTNLQRGIIALSAILLFISIFVPIWRIELDAPQYPEGLKLQIYANKIGGDVDIINGLNHYIGMATLHTENFIEFTLLPFILGGFALLFFLVAYFAKPRGLLFVIILFLIFGVISMIDFYRWNYNYGHNLDPNAAIIVPGMAYQPPLLGYKQLLNFGAFSIPDTGGWLMIISGLLLVLVYGWHQNWLSVFKSKKKAVAFFSMIVLITGCVPSGPEPIAIHKDMCHFCKMKISDPKFGAEIITSKGRIQKFDDIACVLEQVVENPNLEVASFWVADYVGQNHLLNVDKAFFIRSEELRSPMRGNVAAFGNRNEAEKFATELKTSVINWSELKNRDR
jgi:copper chaperone NosL